MNINKQYISKKNTNSAPNKPKYIVIHETDNFRAGANGLTHAKAQFNGHLSTSVHFYCGDDGVYQVADYTSSCWSIGKTYSNTRPIMDATNYNVISIEICVNADGNYTIARDNAIALTKFLMGDLGITEDRVIRHYDAKGKYCPRKMMDDPSLWVDFKNQIGSKAQPVPSPIQPIPISEYYRVGRDWQNGICIGQIGAFKNLENAKRVCSVGYNVYDGQGSVVYASTPTPQPTPKPVPPAPKPQPQVTQIIADGYWGTNTTLRLQQFFGTPQDGIISKPSMLIKKIQKAVGATQDGYLGKDTIKKMQAHFGTPQDGVISKPSSMVKAMQKALNNNKF